MSKKFIVAVHGIGDQVRGETIRLVAYQISGLRGKPGAMALGQFRTKLVRPAEEELVTQTPNETDAEFVVRWTKAEAARQLRQQEVVLEGYLVESEPEELKDFGFAEGYWADIPRGPAKDCYVLDESKQWAKSVVERVHRVQADKGSADRRRINYELAAAMIEEIVEGTRLVERLLFLLEKSSAGIKFDFQKVLTDYLGDVQVVTEFEDLRNKIIGTFQNVLAGIVEHYEDAEIYVVAHSEGTVVALLGLMRGLCGRAGGTAHYPPSPPTAWVKRVRGLMTIGSPIAKHLVLWPELWEGFAAHPPVAADPRIQWINYYDYGDPIGYKVDLAWDMLARNQLKEYFVPYDPKAHDIGFTRYLLPGKAHNDYWTDKPVFEHFYWEVVWTAADDREAATKAEAAKKAGVKVPGGAARIPPRPAVNRPPGTKFWPKLSSLVLPFCLPIFFISLGVFFLYKAVAPLYAGATDTYLDTVRNICAYSVLLIGVTAAARIPRAIPVFWWRWLLECVGRKDPLPHADRCTALWWRVGGYGLFLGSLAAFVWLLTDKAKNSWAQFLLLVHLPYKIHDTELFAALPGGSVLLLPMILLALLVVHLITWLWPKAGAKPLIVIGCVLVFAFVAFCATGSGPYDQKQRTQATQAILEQLPKGADRDPKVREEVLKATGEVMNDFARQQGDVKQSMDLKEFTRTESVPRLKGKDYPALKEQLQLKKQTEVEKKEREQQIDSKEKKAPPAVPLEQPVSSPEKEGAHETDPAHAPSLWPVLLGGAAFVYLWWLAAITLDLGVIWCHYVRAGKVITLLEGVTDGTRLPPAPEAPHSAG